MPDWQACPNRRARLGAPATPFSRRTPRFMTKPRYDVLCIGNAIVDVIADADDAFLSKQGLDKGSMRLIDEAEAVRLYDAMGPGREISGGSAGNTAAGLAALGLRAAFIGQVADDQLGKIYQHDIEAQGIDFLVRRPRRRWRDRALADPGDAGCAADDEHLPRCGAAARNQLGRPGRGGRQRHHLSGRLSVGSARAAGGDGGGDRGGPCGRPQGRLHPVRHILRRSPPRRFLAAAARRKDRHTVRQ